MTLDFNRMTPQAIRAEAKRRAERRAQGLPLHDDTPEPQSDKAIVTREGETVRITLLGPPRTKKNHKQHYAKQSPAYTKWNADVKDQLRDFGPTLPDKPYNLAARFFVDDPGRLADLLGLLQGLADSLENAGVVSNDRYFEGFDGSRKAGYDRIRPRVELEISQLCAGVSMIKTALAK